MISVALLFTALLTADWSGSIKWRGETIQLESCCGSIRAPVATRELEKGYARARADLDAAGLPDVALPPLGTRAFPYTIAVHERPDCSRNCPVGADCPGCSDTVDPRMRIRWTTVRVRDRLLRRLAPVNHEMQHRYCLQLRPKYVSGLTLKQLLDGTATDVCVNADHPAEPGWRYNVLGQKVRTR